MTWHRRSACAGFSLVEVTMAIGLTAFALLAIYSVLPVSFQSLRQGDDRASTNEIFEGLSDGIRHAAQTGSQYRVSGRYAEEFAASTWTVGGNVVNLPDVKLNEGGSVVAGGERYVLAGTITPPLANGTAGVARISVAWPASATFDHANFTWTGAAGSHERVLHFVPRE